MFENLEKRVLLTGVINAQGTLVLTGTPGESSEPRYLHDHH